MQLRYTKMPLVQFEPRLGDQLLVAVDGAGPADTHTEYPGQADHGERVQHPHPGRRP